jgi:hypothetical protein
VKRTADAARYEVDTRVHRLEEVLRALVAKGELEDLTVEDEPLENVIAEIYASKNAAEAGSTIVGSTIVGSAHVGSARGARKDLAEGGGGA